MISLLAANGTTWPQRIEDDPPFSPMSQSHVQIEKRGSRRSDFWQGIDRLVQGSIHDGIDKFVIQRFGVLMAYVYWRNSIPW
jgi:hypothetical protein